MTSLRWRQVHAIIRNLPLNLVSNMHQNNGEHKSEHKSVIKIDLNRRYLHKFFLLMSL